MNRLQSKKSTRNREGYYNDKMVNSPRRYGNLKCVGTKTATKCEAKLLELKGQTHKKHNYS